MRPITGVAAVALAALLSSSCGGSEPDEGSKDDSASSTWSIERSQTEFDAIATNFGEGFDPVAELEDEGSTDIAAWNKACKGYADALQENADTARSGRWPGELKSKMDNFAVLLDAERKGAMTCQEATSMKEVEEGLRIARRDSAGSAGMGIQHYLEEAKASG